MKSTRRSFFAAIGAAVLGKYAVKFFPQIYDRQAVLDYVTACHEQAAKAFAAHINTLIDEAIASPPSLFGLQYYQVSGNAGMYMGLPRSLYPGSPRMNAIITNIGVPKYPMPVRFDPARLPA